MPKIKNIQADQSLSNNDKLLGSDSGGGTRNYTFASITDFLRATNAAGVADQITFKYDTSIGQASGYLDAPSQTNFETNATRTIRISVFSFNDPSNTKADFIQSLLNKNVIISNVDNQNNFGVFTITNISTDGDFKTLTLSVPIAAKGSITSGEIYAIAPSAIGASNLTQVQSTTTNQLTITNGTGPTASLAIVTGAVSDNGNGLSTQAQIKSYVDSQITAQDLDFQGDTGGALSIDLDSETLSIVGTSNEIETAGSGNQIQIGLPNSIVVTTVSNTNQTTTGNLKVDDSGLFTIGANADLRIFHTNNGDIEFQKQGLNKDLTFSISSSSDASVFTELMRFDHSSQNVIFSRPIQLDSVNISAVQTASESFADNDTSIMTSAAIDDRINAAVATKDNTDEITEGSSNLYFTNERVDDRVNALITAGTGITSTYDDAAGTLTLATTITQYTDALARGAISVSGNALSYNSSTGVITSNFEEAPSFTGTVTAVALNMSGDLTISKTDPKITLFDNSGANTDPSGSIVFSESSGFANFDITYNGANDRLEFRGRVSGSDNVDLLYISRQLTTPLQVQGGASFAGNITVTGTVDGIDIAARDAVLTSTTTTANAALPKAGGTLTGDLILGDNVKLELGDLTDGDLQIYHSGTHSFIDNNTGNLYIRNFSDDKNIHFQTDDGSGDTTDYIVIHGDENIVKFQEHTRHLDNIEA